MFQVRNIHQTNAERFPFDAFMRSEQRVVGESIKKLQYRVLFISAARS